MWLKLTASSDVDGVAELSWFWLTPVHSLRVLYLIDVACGSSHGAPVRTGKQETVFTEPVHLPFGRVSLTGQCHRVSDEVLHSVWADCDRCGWAIIWKTTDHGLPWYLFRNLNLHLNSPKSPPRSQHEKNVELIHTIHLEENCRSYSSSKIIQPSQNALHSMVLGRDRKIKKQRHRIR